MKLKNLILPQKFIDENPELNFIASAVLSKEMKKIVNAPALGIPRYAPPIPVEFKIRISINSLVTTAELEIIRNYRLKIISEFITGDYEILAWHITNESSIVNNVPSGKIWLSFLIL